MSLPQLQPITLMFNYETLVNGGWIQDFEEDFQGFGKGIACATPVGWTITVYPDQHDKAIQTLEEFASAFGMSYKIFGEQGVPDSSTDMAIYDDGSSVKQACDVLKNLGETYTCALQDYCGDNAPEDAGLNPISSSAVAASSSASVDVAASSSASVAVAASSSGGSDVVPSSSGGSDVVPSSIVSSDPGSTATKITGSAAVSSAESSLPLGVGISSMGSSEIESKVLSYASAASTWDGYKQNNTKIPVSTESQLSTTIVTVTSCSEDKCSEKTVTTGVTTVYDVKTTYTTFCPLPSETDKPESSEKSTYLPSSSYTQEITTETPSQNSATSLFTTTKKTDVTESTTQQSSEITQELSSSQMTVDTTTIASQYSSKSSYTLQEESVNEGVKKIGISGSLIAAAIIMLI